MGVGGDGVEVGSDGAEGGADGVEEDVDSVTELTGTAFPGVITGFCLVDITLVGTAFALLFEPLGRPTGRLTGFVCGMGVLPSPGRKLVIKVCRPISAVLQPNGWHSSKTGSSIFTLFEGTY